jgi:hypothetical protein
MAGKLRGLFLAADASAKSASPGKPAFVARPEGAPVYYGFHVLDNVVFEDLTFRKITDFDAEPCDMGDAFVISPDGSRAGLVWEIGEKSYSSKCSLLSPNDGAYGASPSHMR